MWSWVVLLLSLATQLYQSLYCFTKYTWVGFNASPMLSPVKHCNRLLEISCIIKQSSIFWIGCGYLLFFRRGVDIGNLKNSCWYTSTAHCSIYSTLHYFAVINWMVYISLLMITVTNVWWCAHGTQFQLLNSV